MEKWKVWYHQYLCLLGFKLHQQATSFSGFINAHFQASMFNFPLSSTNPCCINVDSVLTETH